MPRSKEFDVTKALDQAMCLFWRKGYWATSIEDLVEELGVQRYGIYATFKNKHDLFLAALDRYQTALASEWLQGVEQPDASLPAIEAHFAQLIATAETPAGRQGCLMCNTATELALHNDAVAQKVNDHVQRLTGAFRHALTNAQQQGEIGAAVNAEEYAPYLTGVVLGVSVYAKTPVDREAIKAYVQVALSILRRD